MTWFGINEVRGNCGAVEAAVPRVYLPNVGKCLLMNICAALCSVVSPSEFLCEDPGSKTS